MKFVKVLPLLFTLISSNNLLNAAQETSITPTFTKPTAKTIPAPKTIPQAKIAPAPKVMPKAVTPAAPATVPSSSIPSSSVIPGSERESSQLKVPYLKELQNAKMSPAILSGWQQLYEQFLQANGAHPDVIAKSEAANYSSPVIPDSSHVIPGSERESKSLSTQNPLFSTNFFNLMATYLNPATFPKFANDPDGQIHFNYATTHLRDTVTRLGSISSITDVSGTPAVNWVGDCRDMGIIVNIQNNTDAQFTINQTSLDGTKTMQIGQLNPGLNEVNLHTAALQAPAVSAASDYAKATTDKKGTQQSSATINCFEIVENITNPSVTINLKILSGTELVTFLQSLPHSTKSSDEDTVEMNGLPTSSKYLATPQDWYLVLIQNPSAPGSTQPNPDQRIQAINLSKLSDPYLLSMQINKEAIEIAPIAGQNSATTMNVFQPSLTTVLEVNNKSIVTKNFPPIILPQFLWTIPTMQAYWMLANSSYIAALSGNKFFGPNTFGDALQYFTNLGCFNMDNKQVFCIDLYNILKLGSTFHDATWIMGSALYETNLNYCSDIPQLHSSQDSDGNIIGNGAGFFYINFKLQFHPQTNAQKNNSDLFSSKGFVAIYTQSLYQLWTFLCSILTTEMKEGTFAELTETQSGVYKLTWTDKKNKILNQQFLYLKDPIDKITIYFINRDKNWTGSTVPPHLLNLKVSIKNDFKVTYESMPTVDKHLLSIQATSPIDKSGVLHTTYILQQPKSNKPISELYYDLYQVFQSSSFTRCQIIQNGNLPSFLSNLTIQDWNNGIYLIPTVQNHKILTPQNPGYLTVTFYKSDKTLLGHIESKGLYQNNPSQPGIQHPVKLSTTYSNAFKPMLEGSLTSGLLVKYKN